MDGVAGIIPAGGASRRMGRNKLLLSVDAENGESVIRRAVRVAREAGLDPVIVVTGAASESVAGELEGEPCVLVHNERHVEGLRHSVARGARAARRCPAAVVLLPDMPLVTASMVRALIERRHESGAPLVVSRYGGVDAPPILYDRDLLADLATAHGGCGRAVRRRHRARAEWLDWPAERLRDLDTPDDYAAMRHASAIPEASEASEASHVAAAATAAPSGRT